MPARIIHTPLSGGDRKAQAKGIRYTHGLQASAYRETVLIRSAAEAKLREADRLECEAWNAIMCAGVSWRPSGRADDREGYQRWLRPPGNQAQPLRPRFLVPNPPNSYLPFRG